MVAWLHTHDLPCRTLLLPRPSPACCLSRFGVVRAALVAGSSCSTPNCTWRGTSRCPIGPAGGEPACLLCQIQQPLHWRLTGSARCCHLRLLRRIARTSCLSTPSTECHTPGWSIRWREHSRS